MLFFCVTNCLFLTEETKVWVFSPCNQFFPESKICFIFLPPLGEGHKCGVGVDPGGLGGERDWDAVGEILKQSTNILCSGKKEIEILILPKFLGSYIFLSQSDSLLCVCVLMCRQVCTETRGQPLTPPFRLRLRSCRVLPGSVFPALGLQTCTRTPACHSET